MAKRRASESNGFLNKKPKEDSDSENPDETVGNPDETATEPLNINYEPDQMLVLVNSFNAFCQENEIAVVKNLEKLATEWADKQRKDNNEYIDITMFCQDYKKYLKTAMKVSNMKINDSTRVTLRYLQDEKALTDFKDYPPKPAQVIQIYIKKMDLSKQLNDLALAHETFKKESPEMIAEIHNEHREQEREYVQALSNFLKNHPHLTENQVNSIQSKSKAISKRIDKLDGRRPNTTPKKKEPETAYSVWIRTKSDKYRDLSDEDREKKLRKKFAKLSEPELKLLEDIAMSVTK